MVPTIAVIKQSIRTILLTPHSYPRGLVCIMRITTEPAILANDRCETSRHDPAFERADQTSTGKAQALGNRPSLQYVCDTKYAIGITACNFTTILWISRAGTRKRTRSSPRNQTNSVIAPLFSSIVHRPSTNRLKWTHPHPLTGQLHSCSASMTGAFIFPLPLRLLR